MPPARGHRNPRESRIGASPSAASAGAVPAVAASSSRKRRHLQYRGPPRREPSLAFRSVPPARGHRNPREPRIGGTPAQNHRQRQPTGTPCITPRAAPRPAPAPTSTKPAVATKHPPPRTPRPPYATHAPRRHSRSRGRGAAACERGVATRARVTSEAKQPLESQPARASPRAEPTTRRPEPTRAPSKK